MRFNLVDRILKLNIFVQAAIIFTGAVVRVSGSGLGCPTWPECVPGSFTPTAHQEESWHKFVEFGNRTLTFVLGAVAIAVLVAVWRTTVTRRLRILAAIPLIGTLLQGVVGGIAVLTALHSGVVVLHFLLSVALVWFSVQLWFEYRNGNEFTPKPVRRWLARLNLGSSLVVMVLGSIAAGSGPHSGDAEVASAIPLDPRITSWLHADAVWLFLGVTAAGWLLALTDHLDPAAKTWLRFTTALAMVQGVVGYTQFFSGLPIALVATHVALATAFWVSASIYSLHLRHVSAAADQSPLRGTAAPSS